MPICFVVLDEMEEIKNQTGFEGSLKEFFDFVREDPNNYYADTEEARQQYLDDNYAYLNAINEKLPDLKIQLSFPDITGMGLPNRIN